MVLASLAGCLIRRGSDAIFKNNVSLWPIQHGENNVKTLIHGEGAASSPESAEADRARWIGEENEAG